MPGLSSRTQQLGAANLPASAPPQRTFRISTAGSRGASLGRLSSARRLSRASPACPRVWKILLFLLSEGLVLPSWRANPTSVPENGPATLPPNNVGGWMIRSAGGRARLWKEGPTPLLLRQRTGRLGPISLNKEKPPGKRKQKSRKRLSHTHQLGPSKKGDCRKGTRINEEGRKMEPAHVESTIQKLLKLGKMPQQHKTQLESHEKVQNTGRDNHGLLQPALPNVALPCTDETHEKLKQRGDNYNPGMASVKCLNERDVCSLND
ncbi:uncharacterized protein LOC141584314 isoform X2 [Saimiri boliviensis]|uniref:uncharacterized protein LOC141584314 isoform X2 n=1 Tax=Saimiri boliviensis TaxID=27679 RepID=UPI003D778006